MHTDDAGDAAARMHRPAQAVERRVIVVDAPTRKVSCRIARPELSCDCAKVTALSNCSITNCCFEVSTPNIHAGNSLPISARSIRFACAGNGASVKGS